MKDRSEIAFLLLVVCSVMFWVSSASFKEDFFPKSNGKISTPVQEIGKDTVELKDPLVGISSF